MIRTFITAEGQVLSLSVPDDFIGKLIEIIAFPVEEGNPTKPLPKQPVKKKITVAKISNKSYKFNRDELHLR